MNGAAPARTGSVRPGALALLALLAALALALWGKVESDRAADRVRHTLLVRESAERLLGFARDAETSERGFLLTADERFLDPLLHARPPMERECRRLVDLVRDNPVQLSRARRFTAGVRAKFDAMEAVVAAARRGQREAALAYVRSGAGRQAMQALRDQVAVFKAEESRLLERREAMSASRTRWTLGALGAALVALIATGWFQLRMWRARRDELLARNAELEAEVAARTADLAREIARVEALLADVNHRVGNELASVGVLLALQGRRSGHAEVKAALDEAQARVRMIAEAQRRLRLDVGGDTVRARELFEPAVAMLAERWKDAGVRVEADIEDVSLAGRDGLSLVIMLNELVTNAAKHAFPGRGGRVAVRFRAGPELVVEDDGVGVGPGAAKGMGTTVVDSLARSIGATVRREGGAGTRVIISAPTQA